MAGQIQLFLGVKGLVFQGRGCRILTQRGGGSGCGEDPRNP
ncbi:hypothetical protein CYB_0416 [Synechococcus sp. JA-2-3B'a(2-13)]|nr:hypothetical protein CYB_0416 [Synechococcus sp. JA-2-3B'a(2-13)]